MSKNKKPAAPKKPRTPKPEGAAPKARVPWTTKTSEALAKLGSKVAALVGRFEKVKPPGEWETSAKGLIESLNGLAAANATLTTAEWKPAGRSSKIGEGSVISVLPDKMAEAIFNVIPASTYTGATIKGEDGRESWIVTCTDGVTRTVRKKLVGVVA